MKKITIELDDRYADVLAITAIGHGGGFDQNVNNVLVNVQGRDYTNVRLVCVGDDVERPEWEYDNL